MSVAPAVPEFGAFVNVTNDVTIFALTPLLMDSKAERIERLNPTAARAMLTSSPRSRSACESHTVLPQLQ